MVRMRLIVQINRTLCRGPYHDGMKREDKRSEKGARKTRGRRSEGGKREDPPKRVLFALISDCAWPALLPVLLGRHRVCEEILVLRCEAFRELENLKAVAITDGPELDIG